MDTSDFVDPSFVWGLEALEVKVFPSSRSEDLYLGNHHQVRPLLLFVNLGTQGFDTRGTATVASTEIKRTAPLQGRVKGNNTELIPVLFGNGTKNR